MLQNPKEILASKISEIEGNLSVQNASTYYEKYTWNINFDYVVSMITED